MLRNICSWAILFLGHQRPSVDDNLSLPVFDSVVPEGITRDAPEWTREGRDLEACAQAEAASDLVGLQSHPKEKVRRAKVFKVWGALVDGDRAMVGMDRSKLAVLCSTSTRLAAKGVPRTLCAQLELASV